MRPEFREPVGPIGRIARQREVAEQVALIAGIDEAGVSPVLGPLVVSGAVFEVPEAHCRENLWGVLTGCVSRKVSRKRRTIAIGDSKKLYVSGGSRGIEPLERGVLAMLAASGIHPTSLRSLLEAVCPRCLEFVDGYPWYCGDLELPRSMTAMNSRLSGNALAHSFRRTGIRLVHLQGNPVFAGQFNRQVSSIGNKATLLFGFTAERILEAFALCPPGQRMQIHVDRQGGRRRYLDVLQRILPEARFRIVEETDRTSRYEISLDGTAADVVFAVGAEQTQLPVALASMLSKYVRELFMELLNGYWRQHAPEIEPTAGYSQDGKRFYRQIRPVATRLGIADELFYRCR